MIAFSRSLKFSAIALFGVTLCTHAAQAPQRIDVKQMSKKVENVVVPLPNEIFGALNKLGSVNWREFVRTEKTSNFTERPRIALLLGTVIADGFIAVQAEDAPAVKEIGQRVLNLSKGIGVGNSDGEMGARLRRGGPKTERAIDVNPRAGGMSDTANLHNRIERSGVHVAGLDTDDRWSRDCGKLIGKHSALVIDGNFHDAAAAEAEQA